MKTDPLYHQSNMEDSSQQALKSHDIWSISETAFNQLFENIYNEYVDSLFRFALFRLTDKEKAMDVVQDIFTKYYAYLRKVRDTKSDQELNHRAFLFRSLRNAIVDQYRLKKTYSLDNLIEQGYDEISSDHEDFSKTETDIGFQELLKHIQLLKPELQELLYMRYFENMSVSEIATALNERENSVSVKLHRITETLKKSINS